MISNFILSKFLQINRNFVFKKYFLNGCFRKYSIKVHMPALSPTMSQGTILKWNKKEGDFIKPGDVLCEIQTDKAVLGLEYEEEGVLAKIMKGDNSTNVTVGALIALIAEEGEDWKTIKIPTDDASVQMVDNVGLSKSLDHKDKNIFSNHLIGPAVKSLLEIYDLQSIQVLPTGPHGALLKSDLKKFIAEKNLKPAIKKLDFSKKTLQDPIPIILSSDKPSQIKKMDLMSDASKPINKIKSKNTQIVNENSVNILISEVDNKYLDQILLAKQTIPHSYMSTSCKMDSVNKLIEEFKHEGLNVGIRDVFIKVTAIALQRYPKINGIWNSTKDCLEVSDQIELSIPIRSDKGLLGVAHLKDAASLSVENIAAFLRDSQIKAETGQLNKTKDFSNSFIISDLGEFFVSSYISIINRPRVASLAISSVEKVLDSDDVTTTNSLISVCLSFDNQALDESFVGEFIEYFKELIENPALIISHRKTIDIIAKLYA